MQSPNKEGISFHEKISPWKVGNRQVEMTKEDLVPMCGENGPSYIKDSISSELSAGTKNGWGECFRTQLHLVVTNLSFIAHQIIPEEYEEDKESFVQIEKGDYLKALTAETEDVILRSRDPHFEISEDKKESMINALSQLAMTINGMLS